MKLSTQQICNVALGSVRAQETKKGVRLYRFTEQQEELYRQVSEDFGQKACAASGMKLQFRTDSKKLFLKVNVSRGSSRNYFSFDVMADGKPVGYLNNYDEAKMTGNYTQAALLLGEYEGSFLLGEGMKTVCVYLPWSVAVEILELSLDDGALIEPVRPAKKVLMFGDSITQGYDALHPSCRYAARLAEYLEAEEINKGIGGERFFLALAKLREDFTPDYITVAYGTNDWSGTEEADFYERCSAFYRALVQNYPDTPIFAITPIWREDYEAEKPFGDFSKVEKHIREIVGKYENITCIRGFDFVPGEARYFGDLRLHPNDEGFARYFESLKKQINFESLKEQTTTALA